MYKICFVNYHRIYPGECTLCTWEECVFWGGWMECSVHVYQVHWYEVYFKLNASLLVLVCVIYPLLKVVYWSSLILLYHCLFLPSDISICLIYLGALMMSVYIFMIIITSWWIDNFLITSLLSYNDIVSCYHFWLKVPFVWYEYSHPCSFGFYLHGIPFSTSLLWDYMCPCAEVCLL